MREKRGVLLTGILILFSSLFCLSASGHSTIRGDINGDGVVDMVDAMLIAQYAGGMNPDNFNADAADINTDGKTDDEDAILAAQYALGIISELDNIDKALSSVNLAPNPGFEEGTDGWHNFGASCRLTASHTRAHSGQYSGYMTNRTETWNGPGCHIGQIMEHGRTYTISAWVMLDNAASVTLQVTIKKTDEAGENYTNIASGRVTDSEWAKIAGKYTLRVKGSLSELVLYVGNAPVDVNFYIDDVMIIDAAGGKGSLKTPTPGPTPVYTPTPVPSPSPALKGDERTYLNPILSGFYPDPGICRAQDDYYLVTSSFSYYPGLPIFRSRDLVHWRQIGHVLDRPSQLNLDRLPLSYGLFAPAIHYHEGTFYVTNTLVGRGDNFIVTAKNPEGPWSEPFWIRKARGIDPSLFFDDDGKVYWVSNGNPPSSRYNGHKVIWMQEFDIRHMDLIPETYHILVDSGSNPADNPIWIEAPHLFKVGEYYYVMAAEGGTAEDHSEVIFRSKTITGPYESFGGNPILTQRHLNPVRPNAITCTGHADMVETKNGEWWAVFLGCRPYEPFQRNHYNTGRETFLAPVQWFDGWPIINPEFEQVQYSYVAPNLPVHEWEDTIKTGNFTMREDFESKSLAPYWIFLRTPGEAWYSLTEKKGCLRMKLRPSEITSKENPGFIGRRQQHAYFEADTAILFTPRSENETAGIVAFQNEINFYYMGLTYADGRQKLCLEQGVKQGIAYGGIPRVVTADVTAEKDQFLYKSERYGNIKYAVPVPADQTYTIIFRMAELYQNGPGKRLFDTLVEGKTVMSEFDIWKTVGAAYTAYDTSFSVFVKDQSLDIEFQSIADNASICAIRIEDETGRSIAAMNCGGPEYTSDDGIRYVSDNIYLSKEKTNDNTMTIAEKTFKKRDTNKPLYLKIKGEGKFIGFYYSEDHKKWNVLGENVDNTYLSTKTAGGFVGVVIGLYASSRGKPSSNVADFDWFEYRGNDPVYKTIK